MYKFLSIISVGAILSGCCASVLEVNSADGGGIEKIGTGYRESVGAALKQPCEKQASVWKKK